MNQRVILLAVVTAVLVPIAAYAEDATGRKAVYDEKADAKADIAKAVAKAKRDNKRVLLIYGGNWCGWCHKLHGFFRTNAAVGKIVTDEYARVFVDIGRFDKNMDLVAKYGAKVREGGVPYLTVLDGNGKVLTNQATGPLAKGGAHDPEKVKPFLEKWVAPRLDAEAVLRKSLKEAEGQKKRVLVHLGAPW